MILYTNHYTRVEDFKTAHMHTRRWTTSHRFETRCRGKVTCQWPTMGLRVITKSIVIKGARTTTAVVLNLAMITNLMFRFKMELVFAGERIWASKILPSWIIIHLKCKDQQEDATMSMKRSLFQWLWISAHLDHAVQVQTAKNQIFQVKTNINIDMIFHRTSSCVNLKESKHKVWDRSVIVLNTWNINKYNIQLLEAIILSITNHRVLKPIEAT